MTPVTQNLLAVLAGLNTTSRQFIFVRLEEKLKLKNFKIY